MLPTLGTVVALGREQLDLSDTQGLRAALLRYRPEVLVNAAAYTNVDQAELEPDLAMAVNAHAVGIMAETMRELDGAMLHFSTDYVFDGRARAPMRETDEVGPLNQYGRSKLAGEAALCASGVTHLNFRTSWIYGARGRNFLLTILRLASQRTELRIVEDQLGAPTWCRHVASVACDALRNCMATPQGRAQWREQWSGTYHLSAQGETSWYGFAEEILRTWHGGHMPATPRLLAQTAAEYGAPAARPHYSVLDNAKLQRTFAIQPIGWMESLHQCMAEMPH